MNLWAIDPGGEHVGIAQFSDYPAGPEAGGGSLGTWQCDLAWETDPSDAIDAIRRVLPTLDILVVEEFRLYPDRALAQTGSTMPTCELIGQIKLLHRYEGTGALFLQPAAIQEPTAGVLRRRGIRSTAKGTRAGPHALSAELHGWCWLLRYAAAASAS